MSLEYPYCLGTTTFPDIRKKVSIIADYYHFVSSLAVHGQSLKDCLKDFLIPISHHFSLYFI